MGQVSILLVEAAERDGVVEEQRQIAFLIGIPGLNRHIVIVLCAPQKVVIIKIEGLRWYDRSVSVGIQQLRNKDWYGGIVPNEKDMVAVLTKDAKLKHLRFRARQAQDTTGESE